MSFKPRYREIAGQIHLLPDSSVEFYAVSCAAHNKVCDEFKVHGTPTFLIFQEDAETGMALPGSITKDKVIAVLGLEEEEEEQVDQRNLDEEREDELDGAQLAEEQDDDNPLEEIGDFVDEPPQEPEDDDKNDNENYLEENGYQQDDKEEDDDGYTEVEQPDLYMGGGDADPWFPEDAEETGQQRDPAPVVRSGVQAAREKTRLRREQEQQPQLRDTLRARIASNQGNTSPLFLRKPRVQDGFDTRQIPKQGATDTMKAHVVNTKEFKDRRTKILEQIEQRKGKKARVEVEKRMNDVLNKRAPMVVDKAKLPYRKVVAPAKLGERIPIVKRVVKMNLEESLMLDSTLAFVEGLAQGLFRKDASLTASERTTLHDWLHLLSVALPQEWGIHELIDALMVRKSFVSQSRQNMFEVIKKHAPKRRLYSPSCRATKIPFNCGFWKLLHTVSVGIAEHRGGLGLIEEGSLKEDALTFSPSDAADTIRNYMEAFFPCPYCSKHFVDQYDDCDNLERCMRLADDENAASEADWKELAKWLWEFHNSVSVRILHQNADSRRKAGGHLGMSPPQYGPAKASVMDEIAVLWPTVDSCLKCFNADGSWDEEAVFLHLETQYWPASNPDPKTARLLRLEQELDYTGSGLTMILFLIGIVLFFVMRQSVSKESIQKAIIVAKSVRTGAGMTQKRSD